jgi:DNA polymerase-3 subunit gamma/tau
LTYQVLARKWRPQAFDAVVGQDPVTRTLRNALSSGRVAHAYLFTGPRGVGKTTTARLLAKALACTARTGPEACGACPSCQDFTSGAPVDVMEIDAASNTSVDDIRTLRENVKYAPARGRFKVYIVDEVHMLSGAAFNAFLKTLEEPPAHVVFVLATTDPKKIPATVLSRCQRFDFRPIAPEQLTESLTRILEQEGVPFEPGALPVLIRAAEGSLRDALSLLDTAIAYGEGNLDEAGVARLLGSSSPVHVRGFVGALLTRDGAAALEAIDPSATEGEDLGALCREVIEMARRLLVLKVASGAPFADLTPAEAAELRAAAEPVSADELIYVLRAFLDADGEMRRSPHPRVELEIAAVRATRRPQPQAIETLITKLEEAEVRLRQMPAAAGAAAARPVVVQATLLDARSAPAAPPAPRAAAPAMSTPVTESPGVAAAAGPGRSARPVEEEALVEAAAADIEAAEATPAPAGGLAAAWERVVLDLMKRKALLGSVLQHATPLRVEDGVLALALQASGFHREMLNDRANKELINEAVQRHVASARRFELDPDGGTPAGGGGARNHPAVQAALSAFQGEVVAVRPRTPEEGETR